MDGIAILQNRSLARLFQAMVLSGVLFPLATQGEETRLPIAQEIKKPVPPEVSLPAVKEAIPRSVVIVSDSNKPGEYPIPARGSSSTGAPQGLATPTSTLKPGTPGDRYNTPTTQQNSAVSPPSTYSPPRTTSVLAPHSSSSETLEPITGEQGPMPTLAGQEEATPPVESRRLGGTNTPVLSDPVDKPKSAGEPRSLLSTEQATPRPASVRSEPATPNSQAEVTVPRYAPVAPASAPTQLSEGNQGNENPEDSSPLVAEPAKPAVPTENYEDAPLPGAPTSPPPAPVAQVAGPSKVAKVEITPATFREVEPGVTTLEEIIAAWGEPDEKRGQAEELALLYKIEPFAGVQVLVTRDVVDSILIQLEGNQAPGPLAERLQLDSVRTVEVRNEQGQALGRAFPERGVLFGYDLNAPEPTVAQVLLETIDPQAFYLRAETNWRSQAAASLQDLTYVVEQNPNDAVALNLIARIYLSLGQVDAALKAVDQSRALDSEEPEYRLTRAQCLAQMGNEKEAEAEATAVRLADGIGLVTKARAFSLLGDLQASGSKRNFKAAIGLHMEAIKLVEPLAADPLIATRLKAKEVLIEATLGVAQDVAWGNWNRKEEVVPKWIEKADGYARDAIEHDGAGLELRMMVIEKALAAHTGFKPVIDPTRFLEVAEDLTKRLSDSTKDPLAQQSAEWELGRVYNHAVRLAHLRTNVEEGLKYGEIAQEKLENAAAGRGSSLQARNELGKLYFHIGVLHAVHQQNHEKAVEWYDKAIELLAAEENRKAEDPGQLGEMFVSMGVSYWQVDLKQRALELTSAGTNLVKEAVDQGSVASDSLIVPYGNLASMHAELGQPEKAREINLTAEKLQQTQLK